MNIRTHLVFKTRCKPLSRLPFVNPSKSRSFEPFLATQDAISRLDERVSRHPDREGWTKQRIFQDSCDAQWISGNLVDFQDLALHEAGAPPNMSSHSLVAARARVRIHTRTMNSRNREPITPDTVCRVLGRENLAPENDLALYDPDDSPIHAVIDWVKFWNDAANLPALLRVGMALCSFIKSAPFPQASLGDLLLLGDLLAVASGLSRCAPLALAKGSKQTQWRPTPSDQEEEFMLRFLEAIQSSAIAGRHALDEIELWRERAERSLKGRRRSSNAHLVFDQVVTQGCVSSRSIADETGLTVQSSSRICNELCEAGLLREMTGNSSFRVWGRA